MQQQLLRYKKLYENEKREKFGVEQAYKRQILKEIEESHQNEFSGSDGLYQQATFSIDQNMTIKNEPYVNQIVSRNGNTLQNQLANFQGAHFNTQDERDTKLIGHCTGGKIIMTSASIDNGRQKVPKAIANISQKTSGLTTPMPNGLKN